MPAASNTKRAGEWEWRSAGGRVKHSAGGTKWLGDGGAGKKEGRRQSQLGIPRMNVWDRALSPTSVRRRAGTAAVRVVGQEGRSVTEFPKASLVTEGYLAGGVCGRRLLRD